MRRDGLLRQGLAEKGLTLRFHCFLKGSDLNFFFNRGQLDVAMAGDMPALVAATVSDIVILSLVKQDFSSIVARQSMFLRELRGKRIAFPYGSNAHYALLRALASEDLSEGDIRLVRLDVNDMAAALSEGKIDAFVAWEPFPTLALEQSADFAIVHRVLSSSYLYMDRAFVDRYPEAARLIVASQVRAMVWMRQSRNNLLRAAAWNREARQQFGSQEQNIAIRLVAELTDRGILQVAPAPVIPASDLDHGGNIYREFEFLKDTGMIIDNVQWGRVYDSFDSGILDEVLASPQRYRLYDSDYSEQGTDVGLPSR